MNCPKCNAIMEQVTYQGITVDRCTDCKGIWFDMLEREALEKLKGSEVIDNGDAKVGKKFNEMGRIACPKCKVEMLRMVDNRQPHIWFEGCPTCYGVFLDAGEFSDLKSNNLFDFFKDLFAKERK